MKNRFLLFILLLIGTLTYGQTEFKPGYIITNSGEKQQGDIAYQSTTRNYISTFFKSKSEVTEYGPNDISGFGYSDGRYFIAGIVEGSFVEALVVGDLSLYRYQEKYYLQKENELELLEAREIEVIVDGKTAFKEDNRWKGVLSFFINDCLEDSNDLIQKIDLNEQSLTRIVVRYNKCRGSAYEEYKEDIDFTTFRAGLTAGIIFSKLSITDTDQQSSFPSSYTSTDPSFGLQFLLIFPRVSEKIGLYGEVSYLSAEYEGVVEYSNAFRSTIYTSEISTSTINIPIGIRYSTLEKSISFYAMGGVNVDIYSQWESKLNTTRQENGETTIENSTDWLNANSGRIGFWVGGGVSKSIGKWQAGLGVKYFAMPELGERNVEVDISRVAISIEISR